MPASNTRTITAAFITNNTRKNFLDPEKREVEILLWLHKVAQRERRVV